MSANQRRGFIGMGRLFTPYFAAPTGTIDTTARLMWIAIFPGTVLPPVNYVFPFTVTLTDALAYGVSFSTALVYGVDIADAATYSVTLTDD